MKITWLGHACFLIESDSGTRVVTDPFEAGSYDGAVGYPPIDEEADIVTVSHDHADHNHVSCIAGSPTIVRDTAHHTPNGIPIRGVPVYHDENKGEDRGRNNIYVMEIDGVNVCHLGDLGHALTPDAVAAVGPVDVLLVPVGGHYTIGPEEAKTVAEAVGAKVIVPMHYKTEALGFPIQPVDDFLRLMETVDRPESRTLELAKSDIPEAPKVVVLEYA